jgi:hypothetical protein
MNGKPYPTGEDTMSREEGIQQASLPFPPTPSGGKVGTTIASKVVKRSCHYIARFNMNEFA